MIDLEDKKELNISKIFTFIRIFQNTKDKIINFCLNKKGDSFLLIYHDYSFPNYSINYLLNEDNKIELNNFFFNITKHYKDDFNLMNNESYYLIIQTNESNSNINVKMEILNNEENSDDKNKGLQTWHIIIISVGSLLIIIIIVIIVYFSRKNKVTEKDIEDKVQSLTKIE